MKYSNDDLMKKLERLESFLKTINKYADYDELMTIRDIVDYTNLSDGTVRIAVKNQELVPLRSKGKMLFRKESVDNWLSTDSDRDE